MSNRSNRHLAAASRTRVLTILMLLAMLLASVTVSVSAQDVRDTNNPKQGSQGQPGQPDKLIRTDGAIPGIYQIDYLSANYALSPSKYPIDGSIGFWSWSNLNPASGVYDWPDLDAWIKSRVDRSSTIPTGVGIMISTYDATTGGDISSTPNYVIKKGDTVIPATTSPGSKVPGVDYYIDYYHRTSKKTLNGEFDGSAAGWVVSDGSAIALDTNPPADSHYSAGDTLPNRGASGAAMKLGGKDNVSATLAKDPTHSLAIPAMPPELSSKLYVYLQARVHIETNDASANDHLYLELWDSSGNKLGSSKDITNLDQSGQPANYWQEVRLDVSTVAPEKMVRAAFRVTTDASNPTTFWVDNVQLRVRSLIPKYWSTNYLNAYKTFIDALGARYKQTPLGDAKYNLQFIAMGTGTYGESQPTQDVNDWEYGSSFDHVVANAGLGSSSTGSSNWIEWWIKPVTFAYQQAFTDGGGPLRHLLLQYAPSYASGEERGITTEYARNIGVGISHNRLTTDFNGALRNDKAGFYDPMRLYYNDIPVAVEAYATDLGCSPVMSYWSVLSGVEKHVDYIRTDPDLLRNSSTGDPTGHDPILQWAGDYLGKTVQTAPKVWTVMREHHNPAVHTCSSTLYYGTNGLSGAPYAQYGNYNYWLYQIDGITGGKTVAETNDKGADKRYANAPGTSNSAPDAGLGNCPTKTISSIYDPGNIFNLNTPACNNTPYNPDLPPLVGQSSSNYYNPSSWTGAGKEAWSVRRTDQATDNPFVFFRIDDGYMYGSGSQYYTAAITIQYFDIGTDKFSVKYDSTSGEKTAGTVTKGNTKALKSITFTVTDAKFANRLPGSTDFYLDSRDPATNAKDGNEWLHMVEVEKFGSGAETPTPSPTPTQTLTPSPTPTSTPSTGAVQGMAFDDLNKNNKLDAGEPGVAGAQIALADYYTDAVKYSAASGADGAYKIDGVAPGQYALKEITAPPGYSKSSYFMILSVSANNTNNVGTNFAHVALYTPTPSPTPSATPRVLGDKKTYLPLLWK